MRVNSDTKKICLISLGCPKNLVDAEMMLGFLKKDGFGFTLNPEEGDVIVVNTCGFVEDSKKESVSKILEMARFKDEGRCEVLVATGCLSQRYADELSKEMPEVDLFVGTGEFDKIGNLLREKFSVGAPLGAPKTRAQQAAPVQKIVVSTEQILPDPELPRVLSTPKHYSYLKISEGCSHICSFCIIPKIRGKLKSRPIDSVVKEVQMLVDQGVKEFNLIAQDLNEYGRDLKNGSSLTKLLQSIDQVKGDYWLRPHYMYPLEFNDELIHTLRDAEHIVKYIDMPLQHISERVLLSMKRGSPSRYVRQVLSKLKNNIPNLTLRTTFIVGYPGETKDEFQELCDFVSEYEFDRVGVFKYSIEEGTTAAELSDQLPQEIKDERYDRLMTLQQKISLKKNKAHVGKKYRAIIEKSLEGKKNVYQARLASQSPEIDGVTYVAAENLKCGDFAEIKITGAKEYDLFARAK